MNNFYRTILINIHRIAYYIAKTRIWMRHPERHDLRQRYQVARKMVDSMNKSAGYRTIAVGLEKLPREGGYMMYPNHQGKYDVPGIISAHEAPLSFVMDMDRAHMVLVAEYMMLVDGKELDLRNIRQNITVFKEMAEEIKNQGRKFILFPEGGYEENNQNVVGTFKPGSFKVAQMARCPIVPIALVDSYKVYNSPHKGPVTTYAYFLDPIYYEEYKDMKTPEIAQKVENRIREKIREHFANQALTGSEVEYDHSLTDSGSDIDYDQPLDCKG